MSSGLDVRPSQKERETGGLQVPHPSWRLAPGVPPWVSGGGGLCQRAATPEGPASPIPSLAGSAIPSAVWFRGASFVGRRERTERVSSCPCFGQTIFTSVPLPLGSFTYNQSYFTTGLLAIQQASQRKMNMEANPLETSLPPERIPPGHSW